ncbi:MAG: DUF6384 family protein [Noviherbaspirillum sp.]
MATVSLREQMGAMALIDEMRHQRMIVQEHLDLPRRREEVARRIREYYESQNIRVDEELVEQGVRTYFEGRLAYEAPRAGGLSGALARAYITRASWKKPAAAGIAGLALLGAGGYLVQQQREDASVQRAQETARQVAAIDEIAAQVRATAAEFKAMGLTPAEMGQVTAMQTMADLALQERDAARAREALAAMRAALAYARTPLVFQVADRVGVKSGVERNYRASGGKSWYLIAEAIDPSGQAVPVEVVSAETGERKRATLFGVRVSKETYDSVRADKAADGRIDDKALGEKPANALAPRFTRAYSERPDMILDW